MHPYKRRRVQAAPAEQNEFAARRVSVDEFLGVDLTGSSLYDQSFYLHPGSVNAKMPAPQAIASDNEEASLKLARELQAQEDALIESGIQPSPWVGSSSQVMPCTQKDKSAWHSQAQLPPGSIQSYSVAGSSNWANRHDSLTGYLLGGKATSNVNKRSACQLDAEVLEGEPDIFGQVESRSQQLNELRHPAQPARFSVDSNSPKQFTQQLAHRNCAGCQKRHFTGVLGVVRVFKKWLNRQADPTSCLKCMTCSTVTCIGCGNDASKKKDLKQITVKGVKLDWCCDQGRLFLIWALLCGFDHQQSCEIRRSNFFRENYPRPSNSNSNSNNGIGYGGDHGYGGAVIYSGSYIGSAANPRGGAMQVQVQNLSKAEAACARNDGITERFLTLLNGLLPSIEGESDFDLNPPTDILSMLIDSVVLDKAAELLRNDSLEDATKRCGIYQCVLDFVRALASYHKTAEVAVHGERSVKPEGVDLLQLSFGTTAVSDGNRCDEKTQSIASCLGNLKTQSNMMLQNAKANKADFETHDSQEMLKLCQRISELANFLDVNSPMADGTGVGIDKTTAPEQWQKQNCLLDILDSDLLTRHCYALDASTMKSPAPGRMKRLVLDITHLKTGLPPGIFVRHGSSRLDVMKVLIVGPAGTPYEGGLFEFDLLCPCSYPNKPPKMSFRTTGGGQAHFNPNLYRDGKVCLSLLGTWQGETWKPGKSTLLQVFLSIQAMIFCDEPWCNEPGRESQAGSVTSQSYNKKIQALTVRYAMLSWLQPSHSSVWNDVVAEHFKANGDAILKTVNGWATEKPVTQQPSPYGMALGAVSLSEMPSMSQLASQLSETLDEFRARHPAKV